MSSTWTTIDRTENTKLWVNGIATNADPLYAVFFAMTAPWPNEGSEAIPAPTQGAATAISDLSGIAFYSRIHQTSTNSSIRYLSAVESDEHLTYNDQGYRYIDSDQIFTAGCRTAVVDLFLPANSVSYSGVIRGWGIMKGLKTVAGTIATNDTIMAASADTSSGRLLFVNNLATVTRDPSRANQYRMLRIF